MTSGGCEYRHSVTSVPQQVRNRKFLCNAAVFARCSSSGWQWRGWPPGGSRGSMLNSLVSVTVGHVMLEPPASSVEETRGCGKKGKRQLPRWNQAKRSGLLSPGIRWNEQASPRRVSAAGTTPQREHFKGTEQKSVLCEHFYLVIWNQSVGDFMWLNTRKKRFEVFWTQKSAQFKLASVEKPESILSFHLHSV